MPRTSPAPSADPDPNPNPRPNPRPNSNLDPDPDPDPNQARPSRAVGPRRRGRCGCCRLARRRAPRDASGGAPLTWRTVSPPPPRTRWGGGFKLSWVVRCILVWCLGAHSIMLNPTALCSTLVSRQSPTIPRFSGMTATQIGLYSSTSLCVCEPRTRLYHRVKPIRYAPTSLTIRAVRPASVARARRLASTLELSGSSCS